MVQPNITTKSLAASDFSVKRQKKINKGLKGQHKQIFCRFYISLNKYLTLFMPSKLQKKVVWALRGI